MSQESFLVNPRLPKFRCVLMDPPWMERGGGKSKRGADKHYPLMKTPDIIRTVTGCAEWHNVESDAHCWIWATDNFLDDALVVMKACGFRYLRTAVWVKVKKDAAASSMLGAAPRLENQILQIGLGQYLRGSHELLLLGTRGRAQVPPPERRPPSVIFAPRTQHSRKPGESYTLIESVSPGPRLELFARRPRKGWTVWGNEV